MPKNFPHHHNWSSQNTKQTQHKTLRHTNKVPREKNAHEAKTGKKTEEEKHTLPHPILHHTQTQENKKEREIREDRKNG